MTDKNRRWLAGLAVLTLFAGAFQVGIGLETVWENLRLRNSYQNSSVSWKQEITDGAEEAQARGRRNQELAETMKQVSINQELYFHDGTALAEARIAVTEDAKFGCILTIIRDATGESLYKTGLIEPGHYIERIHLSSILKKGYYPCTAVWSFYADGDEYVGEAAWKMIVIINN